MMKNCDTYFKHYYVIPNNSQADSKYSYKMWVPSLLVTKKIDEVLKFEKNIQEDFLNKNSANNQKENEDSMNYDNLNFNFNRNNTENNIMYDPLVFLNFYNVI